GAARPRLDLLAGHAAAARALPDAPARARPALAGRAVQRTRRRRRGAARDRARRAADDRRRDARARAHRAVRDGAAGLRVTYLADVAALTRKDLLLELRAKETLQSMLLFVIAALTIFHFALPRGTSDVAARGRVWSALIFTALLGLTRAFVAEREQSMFDALILTPVDRSA